VFPVDGPATMVRHPTPVLDSDVLAAVMITVMMLAAVPAAIIPIGMGIGVLSVVIFALEIFDQSQRR
jgi:hypothetical protein